MREGWEYKKLGEIAQVVSGATPKTNIEEYWGEGYYWVTPAELNDATVVVNKTERQITDKALENTKLQLLPKGTILLSSRAPIGKVAICGVDMYCNQGFKNCICSDAIYNKFLFYFLKDRKEYLNSLGRGATFKEISKSIVEKVIVPLPPKSVQLDIVSELDQINELICLKKEQLKDYDALAQSIFYEMFGDPVENEKGWDVFCWSELYDTILGKMLDQKKQIQTDAQLPYLGNTNVLWGSFDLKKLKTMSFTKKEIEKLQLCVGDLLICEGGESGRCAIWKEQNSRILFQKAIHRARAKANNIVPEYTMFWLRYAKRLGGLRNYISKSTIEHLTGKKLNALPIPLPPLPLQQAFAARITQIEQQKAEVQKAIADLETLLASRMQYWFE